MHLSSLATRAATTIKHTINKHIARQSFILRMWNSSILFGDDRLMSARIRTVFFDCGLLHVLVVSGFQFMMLFKLIRLIITGPFQLAYVSGMLSQTRFRRAVAMADLITIVCGWILLLVVDWAISAQRAFAFVLAAQMGAAIKRFNAIDRVVLAFSLQIFLFKEHAFSISSFLSWFIFLQIQSVPRSKWISVESMAALIFMQLFVYSLFGHLNACGLLINIISTPVSLLATALAILGFLDIPLLNPWLEHGISELVSFLLWIHQGIHAQIPQTWTLPDLKIVRASCLGMVSLSALVMTFRSSTKNESGG
jgi:hypothetical protein